MKVLLINISKQWEGRVYREYPYGLGILGTIAQNAGHEVRILDMALDKTPPREVIELFNPEVVGLSFFSPSLNIANSVIDSINSFYDGHLISGGIHSSLFPIEILEKNVDIVVTGEGELVFLNLLDYLKDKRKGQYDDKLLSHIPGIVYRNMQGELFENAPSEKSVDLNKLPIMNRELFNAELYSHHSILTSRGCPYSCRFCCSWAPGGKSGRIMSAEKIIDELQWLVNKYGPLKLYWADEIFFWNIKDRLNFCRMLEEKKLPIEFTIQLRADLITDELVQALKRAGCTKISIGAESGSDSILTSAKKLMKGYQVENGIKTCVQNGMRTKTWWIVGLPGGSIKEQLASLDIIERARPNEVAIHQFVPLPGSEFWNKAEEFGINFPEKNFYDSLNYYSDAKDFSFNYLSKEDLSYLLKEYERRLVALGYVSTDLADESTPYVFTSPFQKKTFVI